MNDFHMCTNRVTARESERERECEKNIETVVGERSGKEIENGGRTT